MNTHRFNRLLALAVLLAAAPLAWAQHVPTPHGSMDAVTAAPTTGPTTAPAGAGALPAGHPMLSSTTMPAHSAGMPTAKTGALRVLVSQGTKGAPPIRKDAARVELYARGVPIKTYITAVDDKGVIELHDLPLDTPFQPVVTVIHNGAEEQLVGPSMQKYLPAVELEMRVFESTATKPAWTVGLRHIIAQPLTIDGATVLRVTEMVGAFNPTDLAWTGEGPANARWTFTLALPPDAGNVQFGEGMAEAGARVVAGSVVRGKTMLPGSNQYVFAYDIPVKDGQASVSFTAPADTTLFALYVPNVCKIGKLTGLETSSAAGSHATDGLQLLKAKSVKAGQVASVELSGIQPPATKPAAPDATTDLHLPAPETAPATQPK